jgi:hypothetical protein
VELGVADDSELVSSCQGAGGLFSKASVRTHPGYSSYMLSGGKAQIQDEKGTRRGMARVN